MKIDIVARAALAAPLLASPAAAGGISVPITLSINPKVANMRVYSIPVMYGSTTIQSLLDTGSVPALVLPGYLASSDYASAGGTFKEVYGKDRVFKGDQETATVAVGGISGNAKFGLVNFAKCDPPEKDCPFVPNDPHKAFFGGTLTGIFGAQLKMQTPLTNAFYQIGIHRYVITAPRDNPRENVGQLLLDPSANDTSTYVPLALSGEQTAFPGSAFGCLKDVAKGSYYCGPVILDTGRTGIEVVPAKGGRSFKWTSGDAAQLEFETTSGATIAGVDFKIGVAPPLSVKIDDPGDAPNPTLYVGQLPYLGLSILTDFDQGGYAVKARPPQADGTTGHVP